jgi:hypothetical protein
MPQWADFPWKAAMFANADESILRQAPAAAENCYANAAGGFSRFPGLKQFASMPGAGRVVLHPWKNELLAVGQDGRVRLVRRDGTFEDRTGAPLVGTGRPVFAATDEQIVIASGGPLISLSRDKTEILSQEAPNSTHVAFIDSYLVAIEAFSGRFSYCDPGQYRVWNPLSVFSADGKPDDLNACVVTPFRELLLCGEDSIEQFERLQSGTVPFYRRWSTGEGLAFPYTLVADVAGTYGVNMRREFVRFSAQVSREQSENVALALEEVDDWTDAWADTINIKGQRFVILQAPHAYVQHYNVRGLTLIFDYRTRKWAFLWGWDDAAGTPARWPGWSIASQWGKTLVGVDNGVAELDVNTFDNLGKPQRVLLRSAHVDDFNRSRIDNVQLRLRRGFVPYGAERQAKVAMRMIRDNGRATEWAWRDMGAPGENEMVLRYGGFGYAATWQMEIMCSDPVPFEFVRAQVYVERVSW